MNDITRITATQLPRLPQRPADGHKGTFGRVLVVGGSETMLGAPVLAGTAALRMGSGLVQVAMPQAMLAGGLSITPELIGLELDGEVEALIDAAQAADVIAVGPGLGTADAADAILDRLLQLDQPAVVDADALNLIARRKQWPATFKAKAVLTPHPGEMKRLGALIGRNDVPTDDDGRTRLAVEAARAFGQIMVLKGSRTVVTDGRRVYLNDTGDSSLSKAGTGDVLSGMIASLIGQKMEPFFAAAVAVRLHGRAGEIAGQRFGCRSVLARDVIDAIPETLREIGG